MVDFTNDASVSYKELYGTILGYFTIHYIRRNESAMIKNMMLMLNEEMHTHE